MLPENFRSQYVKCTKSKGFTSPSSEYKWLYLTETRYCSTQWIKVRSNQVLQVCKSPFDQVEAFRNDLEEFWPYVEPTAATPAICKSLSSFNQLVTESKSRLKRAPLSAAAASITKKSKVNAVSDGNGSTNKVLFMAATGVQVETVVDNGCGDDMEVNHDAEDLFGSSMIDAAAASGSPVVESLQEKTDDVAGLSFEDQPAPTTSPCLGYTEAFLQSTKRLANKDKAIQGFLHLCGEGVHNRASAISNRLDWKYDDKICGVIRGDKTDLYTVSCSVSNTTTFVYAIRSTLCSGSVTEGGRSICDGCFDMSCSLYRRCYKAVRCSF